MASAMRNVFDKFGAAISFLRAPFRHRAGTNRTIGSSPKVLAVVSDGPGLEGLRSTLREAGWDMELEHSMAAGVAHQGQSPSAIVLYDRRLPDSDWRQAIVQFSRMTPRPCLILLSPRTDRNLWDEVVRCGGFDLLRIPLDRDALLATLRAGLSIWQSQRTSEKLAGKRRS